MGRKFLSLAIIAAVLSCIGCDHLDDERIPPSPVYIPFTTVGEWNVNGVGGALDYKRFIKEQNIPAEYHYPAMGATGFGGVLLVCDVNGNPVAYDLSCPVECKRDIRIYVDTEALVAKCPKCESTYDIFSLGGHPLSGLAANDGFGLRRYNVGSNQSQYMVISN